MINSSYEMIVQWATEKGDRKEEIFFKEKWVKKDQRQERTELVSKHFNNINSLNHLWNQLIVLNNL